MEQYIKKEYTDGVVTVTWEPSKCIYSGICVSGLPNVFRASERPWIKMGEIDSDTIVEQVKKCPSGALGYFYNK